MQQEPSVGSTVRLTGRQERQWTSYLPEQTYLGTWLLHCIALDEQGTQLCSLHSLTHKRQTISAMFNSNKTSQHNLNSNIPHKHSIAHALHACTVSAYSQDRPYLPCSVYIGATHNITHSPCTSKCTTYPPLPTQLPSTTFLYKQTQSIFV